MAATLNAPTIAEAAARLHESERTRTAIRPLVETYPALTADDAYRVQLDLIDRNLEEGARIVGRKIRLTSVAMQQLLGSVRKQVGRRAQDVRTE